jgi:hypothetical protein
MNTHAMMTRSKSRAAAQTHAMMTRSKSRAAAAAAAAQDCDDDSDCMSDCLANNPRCPCGLLLSEDDMGVWEMDTSKTPMCEDCLNNCDEDSDDETCCDCHDCSDDEEDSDDESQEMYDCSNCGNESSDWEVCPHCDYAPRFGCVLKRTHAMMTRSKSRPEVAAVALSLRYVGWHLPDRPFFAALPYFHADMEKKSIKLI